MTRMDKLTKIALSAAKSTDDEKVSMQGIAKAELARIESIFSDSETKIRIDTLKDMFSQCEIVYKVLLKEYKKNTGKKTYEREKIYMTELPYVFSHAGYNFDQVFLKKIFGSETKRNMMSVKVIRDKLNHEIKKSTIEELNDRFDELIGYMETFLNTIRNC